MTEKKASFQDVLDELAQRGLDLRGYKRSSLERRVRRRMDQIKARDFDAYLRRIRDRKDEANTLLQTVLINVTRFFRDPQAWDVLYEEILPPRMQALRPGSTYRAWCAGSSTGEEAYSVAILLAELLGPKLHQCDIKIYATDGDQEAVTIARRGEYSPDALRLVRPAWQKKYFEGATHRRVHRDLRKLVIFGHSDLAKDAAISHVDLLVCRNVLIYFEPELQRHILRRFQYAVEPGGILFLGKSETHLRLGDSVFRTLNSKWRIFERTSAHPVANEHGAAGARGDRDAQRAQQELQRLRAYHETLLQTLEPGVLVLDSKDTVITDNEAVRRLWGLPRVQIVGSPLADSPVGQLCPELPARLEATRNEHQGQQRFTCRTPGGLTLTLTVKPILSESGAGRVGTLIYMEDVTHRETLQHTVEELQATGEELQSSNEELETTNEELQSANEELETTNEELQSANEELETTNEELQSLNEELETTNEELAVRTHELEELGTRYRELLERMPWPVLLVNRDKTITLWSSAAQKLFGFATPSARGIRIEELPVERSLRKLLARRAADVAAGNRPRAIRNRPLDGVRSAPRFDIHLSPLAESGTHHGVLIMFQSVAGLGPMKRTGELGHEPGPRLVKKKATKKKAKTTKVKKKPARSRGPRKS